MFTVNELTKELLVRLYVEYELSVRDCALLFGITHGTITGRLKKYGVQGRKGQFQNGNQLQSGNVGEKSPTWNGGKRVVFCAVCGKQLKRYPSQAGRGMNFCGKLCHGIWKTENTRGPANPNWRGGVRLDSYCDAWKDKRYKKDIMARDNNQCQNPLCLEQGNLLTVHHIDYNKENCHPNNLITLCNSCNSKANSNRNFWYVEYSEIMHTRCLTKAA